MRLQDIFGIALFGFVLAACGDGTTGGGGSGGTASQGGGGGGPCAAAADCPVPADECQAATCVGGVCGTAPVADGEAANTQAAGDCKKVLCQAGAPVSSDDDTDVPDDGKDCTIDGCSAGVKTTEPAAAGTACAQTGKVCDGEGECVECISNADCADPEPLCDAASHTCIPIDCTNAVKDGNETDVDCGGLCAPCDDGKACVAAADCQSGVCTGAVCQPPACDDGVKNGAETGTDCGGIDCPKCGPDEGCDSGDDCVGGECTGMGGTCVPNCVDQAKDNDETDVDCGGPTCAKCGIGKQCDAADANCVAGAYCDMMGVCAPKKANAGECMASNECTSAHCVDGVCCNVACAGLCAACALPGSVGMCAPQPVGADPDDECAGNGGSDVCDGGGGCAKATGSTCAANGECATGHCVDGVCCDTPCNGLCKACSAAKTGGVDGQCGNILTNTDPESECVGVLDCNGAGACEAPLANGTPCAAAGECASNFCVDGVCCNSACGGLCAACTMALKGNGVDGQCGLIAAGTDPQNECAGAMTCNGAGACN